MLLTSIAGPVLAQLILLLVEQISTLNQANVWFRFDANFTFTWEYKQYKHRITQFKSPSMLEND